VALPAPGPVAAPSPVLPGAGRSSVLPRDPGRATEWLYRRHGDTVFRYAWHLLGRREDAEDATQATFLAVHKALAGGTAVLDSSAWVLRIARNECMGRLRQTARRPAVSLDDGFDPPAAGGVERSAELRDEVRTARRTLRNLPEPEREAFVMREWLGLETGETALALGLNAGDVDGLASRARRSLVLAVGGLEPPIGCSGTRAALEAGSLNRAAKVHLLRCPVCRGVRRALRPPEGAARPVMVERLSAAIPGFASGGGILAALTAKAASAPVLAKTAAIVVAAVAAGGAAEQAIVGAQHPAHHRSHGGQAQVAAPARGAGSALVALVTPSRTTHASTSPASSATRGAAATPTDRHGSNGPGDDRGGHASGRDDSGSGDTGSGDGVGETSGGHKGSGRDESGGSGSGDRASNGDGASSGKDGGGDSVSRSGRASGSGSDAADETDSGSGTGSAVAGADASDESSSSGSGSDHHGDADGSGQTSASDEGSPVVTDPAAASSDGGGSD
jgi:RNA polymerase sigma factor (sigma-70 family)